MEINTPNYKGKCRRGTGKLTLSFQDYWKIGLAVFTILAFGLKMQFTVNAHDEILKEVSPKKIATIEEKVNNIENDVAEIKAEQKTVVQDIKNLNISLNDKFTELLREIKNGR